MPFESPLLIFTCNRAEYLRASLDDIQRYIRSDCLMGCPVILSQDGNDTAVTKVIRQFKANMTHRGIPVVQLQHSSITGRFISNPYEKLSKHYGWALEQIFSDKALAALRPSSNSNPAISPQRVLILEEDLHISPDFFDYFTALAPLLDQDPTLLAISAFNDNGFASRVQNNQRLLRTDFFPGLGWMMTRTLWQTELMGHWPDLYWDDWMRDPAQRKDRHIIRPEVSRTFHFGVAGGASGNQYGDLLAQIKLNMNPVNWTLLQHNLSVSLQVDRFHNDYMLLVQSARPAASISEALRRVRTENIRLDYTSFADFRRFANRLNLMADIRFNTPRTSYHGIVETRPFGKFLLFLTPKLSRKK